MSRFSLYCECVAESYFDYKQHVQQFSTISSMQNAANENSFLSDGFSCRKMILVSFFLRFLFECCSFQKMSISISISILNLITYPWFISPFTPSAKFNDQNRELIESSAETWPKSFTSNELFLTNPICAFATLIEMWFLAHTAWVMSINFLR